MPYLYLVVLPGAAPATKSAAQTWANAKAAAAGGDKVLRVYVPPFPFTESQALVSLDVTVADSTTP